MASRPPALPHGRLPGAHQAEMKKHVEQIIGEVGVDNLSAKTVWRAVSASCVGERCGRAVRASAAGDLEALVARAA